MVFLTYQRNNKEEKHGTGGFGVRGGGEILLCSRPAFAEWFNYAHRRLEARHGDVARAHLMSRLAPLGSLELVPADSTCSWRKSDWSKCKSHRPPLPPKCTRCADKHTQIKNRCVKTSRLPCQRRMAKEGTRGWDLQESLTGLLHVASALCCLPDSPKAMFFNLFEPRDIF